MARKRYKPEEIVAKLRQVDVLVSQGQSMAEAIRQIGVSTFAVNSTVRWFYGDRSTIRRRVD
jgi:putative transposase